MKKIFPLISNHLPGRSLFFSESEENVHQRTAKPNNNCGIVSIDTLCTKLPDTLNKIKATRVDTNVLWSSCTPHSLYTTVLASKLPRQVLGQQPRVQDCDSHRRSVCLVLFAERVIDNILSTTKAYGLGEELDRWRLTKTSSVCVCVHQVVCVTNMWLSGLAVSAVKDASLWATAASCPTSPSAPESMTMMLLSGKFRQTEEELSAVTFSNLSTSCPLQV